MAFSEDEIRAAGRAVALGEHQIDGLVAVLRARHPEASAPARQPAHERVRFDLEHLLWYAGALIVMGAMGLFSTLAFEQIGGQALTVTALLYAGLFIAGGHYLWHRRRLPTPGGLMIAVAVAMAPLAVFGIQDALGLWDEAQPQRYKDFYFWIKGSWVPMEIATIVAGLVMVRFYPFPFIIAVVAGALWFLSMDLTSWLYEEQETFWAKRRQVSMIFGLVVLAIAWTVDVKRDQRQDFAFWLHLSGLLAFWGGLTFSNSDNEFAKAVYCLINVGLVLLSVFLMRRVYALFGAVGVSIYLGHLASRVFEDSLLFPFALSLIGLLMIAAGLFLHRHHARLSTWMATRLPQTLNRLRPPHATAAARLEHA